MDNKAVFIRTRKGEDEAHSRTSHLAGDLKRALLMVDGESAFGEISKRAAPSLRASLDGLFEDLEKDGFIEDKDKKQSVPKIATPPKMAAPPKMSVPSKVATPAKPEPVEEEGEELDFLTGFSATPSPSAEEAKLEAVKAEAEAERQKAEQLKAEAEARTRQIEAEKQIAARMKAEAEATAQQIEAEKLKAKQEADAIRQRAEQEAARLREEAERRTKEAEAARIKAEQEARKLREEAEAAKLKAEQEARMRLEAAAKAKQEAEAARVKAEQEAAQIHADREAARLKAELEVKAELEAKVREEAAARAQARMKAEEEAARAKSREIAAPKGEDALAKAKAAELAKAVSQSASGQGAFAFEAFQLGGTQPQTPGAGTPSQQPPLSGGFAFDSFRLDIPSPGQAATPVKPAETSSPAGSAPFALDSFRVDESRPATEPQKIIEPLAAAAPLTSAPDAEQLKRTEQARLAAEEQTREAQARKLAEEQARKQAEEHARRKMAEELARKQTEEQEKKLAEEQAKVWAEAEQRALEAAKASAEKVQQPAEQAAPAAKAAPQPTPMTRKKSFSFGKLIGFAIKLGIFLLVLLVGAIFAVPYVMPMRQYMPQVEKLMSTQLNQPVHIGYLSARILPTPQLQLGEVYIGEIKQFQADQLQLNFSFTGLLDEKKKPIDSVAMQDVKVSGKGLQAVAAWLQKLASSEQYPIRRIGISQGRLDADVFELTGIEGEIGFDPAGKYTKATLRANGGKYTLNLNATPEGKWQAAIAVRGSALPLLPNWAFDDLTAKGELTDTELLVSNFDAHILGATLQGKANLNWRSGWRAQGEFTAKGIAMKQLNELLEGSADGSARFKMTALDLAGLTGTATLEGNFSSADGTINGMDIAETANKRSREHLPGGRTHYKELSGAVSFADDAYHFSQVKIASEVMNAFATLNIEKRQLSGNINAKPSIREGTGPVDLQLDGTTDSPQLRATR